MAKKRPSLQAAEKQHKSHHLLQKQSDAQHSLHIARLSKEAGEEDYFLSQAFLSQAFLSPLQHFFSPAFLSQAFLSQAFLSQAFLSQVFLSSFLPSQAFLQQVFSSFFCSWGACAIALTPKESIPTRRRLLITLSFIEIIFLMIYDTNYPYPLQKYFFLLKSPNKPPTNFVFLSFICRCRVLFRKSTFFRGRLATIFHSSVEAFRAVVCRHRRRGR